MTLRILLTGICVVLISSLDSISQAQSVRSPAEFLKRPLGTDFRLADWSDVQTYYESLASSSPNVSLINLGKTTEGRDFLQAVISSSENLSELARYQHFARRLAHPEHFSPAEVQEAVAKGKIIAFITLSMHSTETASTEMGMQLAWLLATSQEPEWTSIRENAIVVLVPSLNPDGVDHVVNWYRDHVGTPFEGVDLPRLYQLYSGHDNNRDWFSLTQVETRMLTESLYQTWFPQVLWDAHEYGSGTRERFFVPPYRDPLNPNLDPGIVAGINLLGTRAALDMTRSGLTGIAQGVGYDHWWNGGNRSVPSRHNIMGILTEAASVNIASPKFIKFNDLVDPLSRKEYQPSNQFVAPWEGGWWRLSDIHRYQLAFGKSILSTMVREREFWLKGTMEAARRAAGVDPSEGQRAWIIPSNELDRGSVARLIDVLLVSGVEVQQATTKLTADDRIYPAGSLVISRAQAYGNYAKDLLELQKYPTGQVPYDVTGWSLPALFGVRCVEVTHTLEGPLTPVASVNTALAAFAGDQRLSKQNPKTVSLADHESWKVIVDQLQKGLSLQVLTSEEELGLAMLVSSMSDSKPDGFTVSKMPRIGLYAPYTANIDEGWLRWTLESSGFAYQSIRNEMLNAGQLDEMIDVLILPDVSTSDITEGNRYGSYPRTMSGGLDGRGISAIDQFVQGGGTVIGCQRSANWLQEEFDLPVKEVTQKADPKIVCPGSVLRAQGMPHEMTVGIGADQSIFFSSSLAWDVPKKLPEDTPSHVSQITAILKYAPRQLLVAGTLQNGQILEDKGAWVKINYGKGQFHLFGFRPYYRGWSQGSFHLLYRAILLNQKRVDSEKSGS